MVELTAENIRCQLEQQKLNKNVRHVGAGVPTRPGDISSDDESDEGDLFDPVIVERLTDEGKMMSQWLQAARNRVGGSFPRKNAVKATEKYLNRLKNGKAESKDINNIEEQPASWGSVDLHPKEESILKRWLSRARQSATTRYDDQANDIREELHQALGSYDAEDDWATGELRLEGNALKIEGDQLTRQKKSQESQLSTQLETLRSEFELVSNEMEEQRSEQKQDLDETLSRLRTIAQARKESRKLELRKKIDDIQEKYGHEKSEEIRKEVSDMHTLIKTEMEAEDERLQSESNELMTRFTNQSNILDREIQSTARAYERDCQTLSQKSRKVYLQRESEWQKNANAWLGRAKRKIEEHSMARTKNPTSAKKARKEERVAKKQE